MDIQHQVLSQLNAVVFAKDLQHRLIYCNEKYAQISGENSPRACLGKTDAAFIWKDFASIYMTSDKKVYAGRGLTNLIEPQKQIDKHTLIMINKHPLLGRSGEIQGIVGSFIEFSHPVANYPSRSNDIPNENGFSLGEYFNHECLSHREYQVLTFVLLGRTAKFIAEQLDLSPKTVESYIASIKLKMQCKTQGDIIYQSVLSGLYAKLFPNCYV